jgi:hypothetical protein
MAERLRRRLVVTTLRLPEDKHRVLRMEVVRRGTSLQKALEEAIEIWLRTASRQTRKPLTGMRLRGLLRDTNVMEIREEERRKELAHDRERL